MTFSPIATQNSASARAIPASRQQPIIRFTTAIGFLFVLSVLLRLVALGVVPLIPEEAYYWMYSENPSLSYYDHPPMIAWMIRAGVLVFGDTEIGVRIAPHLLMFGATMLMYQFARLWHTRRASILAAAMLNVLPVYFGIGFIATMDSTLLFFWLGCLLSIGMALLKNRPIGWYFAGIALGSAMLTKYTAIFLVAGTVLVLVTHRPWRKHLLSIHPWLGAVIAAGMFSPVILWNAHNDWASFRFQFIDRFGNDTIGFLNPAGFAIIQFLVLTPPVLVVCAGMIARWFRNRRFTNETLFAMAFSLPLLATMAYKSLTAEVHLNWTAPAFLSLIPAISAIIAAGYTHANLSTRIEAFGQWMRWSGIACILVNCGILLFLLVLQPHLRWISAFGPWTDLAHAVEDSEDALEHQTHQEPLIIADGRYRLASVLAFYRTPVENYVEASQFTTSQWILGGRGVGYEFWSDRNDWIGANCLYITDDTHMLADLSRWFDRVEPVDDPRLNNGKAHYMAWCFGLKAQPRKSIQ